MEKKRIVITGIGVVAPNGIGKEEFWANCFAGVSGIKPITLFDVSKYRCRWAGEISNFQPEKYLGPKGLRNLDRTTLLALVAAKLAIDDARLEITDENRNDIGVVLGTNGSIHSISEFDKEGLREGPRYVNPAHFPNTVINSPASQVAIRYGLKGLNTTISTGFTASLDAIGYAMDMLRLGRVKVLLVGGAEELCIQTYLGFYKLSLLALTPNGSLPTFAPGRVEGHGTILGEGAVFLICESEAEAQIRRVEPLAIIEGYGTCFDPKAMYRYDPEAKGACTAVRAALVDAGIEPEELKSISSCANGVYGCDTTARQIVDKVLRGRQVARVFALKGLLGETFSADGALRLAAAIGGIDLDAGVVCPSVLVEGSGPIGTSSAVVLQLTAVRSKAAMYRSSEVATR